MMAKELAMLKNGIQVINKNGLQYIIKDDGKLLTFKPWLGDAFSFLYDVIMQRSIFPKKFGGDMNLHYQILGKTLQRVHGKRVLELATGTGSAIHFLPNRNQYTGTDISPGLLRKAVKRFRKAGFEDARFFVARADDLPFDENRFDIILCILSLNFFDDLESVLKEVKRVGAPTSLFFCCVPVPERNKRQSTIRGTLLSEKALATRFAAHGFDVETIPAENGALLYFKATRT